jgi:tetratricopeptide (TPR) repeat protein
MNPDTRFQGLIDAGLAASRDNHARQALDLFEQASALQPASGIPHFLIGSEHAAAGDMPAAESAFANAVLLAPEFALARYQLGLLQFTGGRAAVALVTWGPLFSLGAGEPLGQFVRGFAALAQDRFEESLEHFQAGLRCQQVNPAVAADITQVTDAVQKLARRDGAAAPDSSDTHVLLAAYGRGLH